MTQNLFNRFLGKTVSEYETNLSETQQNKALAEKGSFGDSKEPISHPQIGSFAPSKSLFEEPKEPILQRIESLEVRVKGLERELKQAKEVIERMLTKNPSEAFKSPETTFKEQKAAQTFYLSAPSSDGIFTDFDRKEQMGKSIYRLNSDDGKVGMFAVLNTVDAVSTAVISISQFIKPACKIENSIEGVPNKIVTTSEGEAVFNGEAWVIRRKATVRIE